MSGEQAFLVELAKYGLNRRDMAANLNLFSKVAPDAEGNLHFVSPHSQASDFVELRFEMDSLVLFHTCPHPLNPAADYPKKPIAYQVRQAAPVATDDYCLNFRPENQRGFQNNHIYHSHACCGGSV